MSALISIITPTLNSANKIEACLLSVANQTYKNVEHLIIDGLSSDATLAIIKKYQTQYSHIRLISEKDMGIYDSMNKGINLAKGDWLYFLGSDDRLLSSEVLREINKVIVLNNYDIVYGNVISSRFQGRYDFAFDQEKILNKNICHQAIFFKRDIFNKTGLFNLRYKSHSDWDHNMKWILNPTINKAYFEIDIADYSDGGFSSVTIDNNFDQDKLFNYLKYGIRIFTYKKSRKIIYKLVKKYVRQKQFKNTISLGFLLIKASYQTMVCKKT